VIFSCAVDNGVAADLVDAAVAVAVAVVDIDAAAAAAVGIVAHTCAVAAKIAAGVAHD